MKTIRWRDTTNQDSTSFGLTLRVETELTNEHNEGHFFVPIDAVIRTDDDDDGGGGGVVVVAVVVVVMVVVIVMVMVIGDDDW